MSKAVCAYVSKASGSCIFTSWSSTFDVQDAILGTGGILSYAVSITPRFGKGREQGAEKRNGNRHTLSCFMCSGIPLNSSFEASSSKLKCLNWSPLQTMAVKVCPVSPRGFSIHSDIFIWLSFGAKLSKKNYLQYRETWPGVLLL